MKVLLVAVLCISIPCVGIAAENSYHVVYDGGSISEVKTGKGMKLFIDSNNIR